MLANEEYKAQYNELLAKYGSATLIPKEETAYISELLRAKWVLESNKGENNKVQLLSRNMVPESIIKVVLNDDTLTNAPVRKEKRTEKYEKILDWVKENAGKETTVYEVAEIGGVSYPTANSFIKDRVDLFRRVKKGSYIVRDPEAERAMEK